jgi:hypothetical protein
MTPRGLRRLDENARAGEELDRRRRSATARRDLETAVGRVNELQRELGRTRNEAALAGIAARIGAQAHELERAALELASTIEPRRYGR